MQIEGYNSDDFDSYDSVESIRKRLLELDPIQDSIFELCHLNREAVRLLSERDEEKHNMVISGLNHTYRKEIMMAVRSQSNPSRKNQERIKDFEDAIKFTKMYVPAS